MIVRTHRIQTAEATLEAETWGDSAAAAALLIAGTSCTRDWWPPDFCRMLVEAGCHVIRYDQRDTGASSLWPDGEPGYSLDDLTTDAVSILDFVEVPRAHVVGFSQGGWVAQQLALRHPDRVASMTLIASRPTEHGAADPDLPEVSDRLLAAWESTPDPAWDDESAIVDYYVESERVLAGDEFDAEAARQICAAAVARSADLRTASNHQAMPAVARWRGRLPQITVPTTVIHGTADPLFPFGNGEALAREIPGAVLTPLPGVGHELPSRAWPLVTAAISRHVRGTRID